MPEPTADPISSLRYPEHDAKVAAIAAQVKEKASRGLPVHITKRGVHHVVPLPGDPRFAHAPIDVSALDQILAIDPASRTCIAEPGVSFARLVEATLRHGLIPTTVPELEGITIGGAVAGCSVEAMSYRYGGFHDSCLEYEVISGEGEVLTLSPSQQPELFHMIHGSYGTLGILARLKFHLVPAKPYVRMEYRRLPTIEAYHDEILALTRSGEFELVDGIIHGPGLFVLCLGKFVDKAPYVSSYKREEIFYKSTLTRDEDYLETAEYCFRYDAECHWLTRTLPPLEWKPVRRLLGKWLLGSTNLIGWSNRLAPVLKAIKRRPDVVCDIFVPVRRFVEFYRWYERDFNFFPLWIVPYRMPMAYPWMSEDRARRVEDELSIDCAIYGRPNSEPDKDYSKLLEDKVFELDGIKTLIGRNHYDAERFWQIYHREHIEAAKARLDPKSVFPKMFETFGRVG